MVGTSDNITALIKSIVSNQPSYAIVLERDEVVADIPELGWTAGPAPIRIEDLQTPSSATTARGYPGKQSEVDAVKKLLGAFNRARSGDAEKFRLILMLWVECRRKDDDWASMSPDKARAWVSQVTALMPGVPVQAQHWTKDSLGKTRKSPIVDVASSPKALDASVGHYLVRFGEDGKKIDSRHRKTKNLRSRSQGSITWLVLSVANKIKQLSA